MSRRKTYVPMNQAESYEAGRSDGYREAISDVVTWLRMVERGGHSSAGFFANCIERGYAKDGAVKKVEE
jgi:hypothetical protein